MRSPTEGRKSLSRKVADNARLACRLTQRFPTASATALGGATGAVAWSGGLAALAIAPVAVLLWSRQSTRRHAMVLMLAYYLAAAHGLPLGASQFYRTSFPVIFPVIFPVSLWLGASLLLALPWCVLWGRQGFYWRVPAALALCSVPPIGLVGWASPVSAAGIFFTGLGWTGLGAMVAALVGICYRPRKTAMLLTLCAVLCTSWSVPAPDWIEAVDTTYGGAGAGGRDFIRDYHANRDMTRRALGGNASFMLFPESVAGLWTPATQSLWDETSDRLREEGRSVLVGAEMRVAGTGLHHNALLTIGAQRGQWSQRIPVPIAMWRPWSEEGTQANLLGDGTALLNGHRVAVFICYEQLLVWPMLLSQAASPELIIGVANSYWAAGTNLSRIQRTHLEAWARLYGQPVVAAFNH